MLIEISDPIPPTVRNAVTLRALLNARVEATPEAEALRFGDRSMTFAELRSGALTLAEALHRHGVGAGDRVAIMMPNGLDVPLAWFAIVSLRAIVVPVNVRYARSDLAHVLNHSGASAILAGPEQRPMVDTTLSSTAGVRVALELSDGVLSGPTNGSGTPASLETRIAPTPSEDESTATLPDASDADTDEPVAIQYTSGTTGFPKGCVLHHGYWLRLARTIQGFTGLGPDDVLLTAQPQSYMDPTWNLVLAVLAGAPLVILPRFSASHFWSDVTRSGATFFYCIGTMPLYLLEQPEGSSLERGHQVRLVYCSGIPASRHAEMERRWDCIWRETYGTTELGVVLAVMPDDATSVGSGSMGHPVQGRTVMIGAGSGGEGSDVEWSASGGAGGEQSNDESGEILVRGPDTMLRYHDDPEATAAWSADGWVHTGDIVRATELGYSHVGRTKDMIRRAGENISAVEVESVLVEHPHVQAAACIPVPDDLCGEEVKAYVLPCEGITPSEADLHAFVATRLAPFKVPRYIELVDSFPLTQSEKIAKATLATSRADHLADTWDATRAHSKS